jgi:signal transduction histidine kinase
MGQIQIYIFIILATLIVFAFIVGILVFLYQYRRKAKEYHLEKQLTAMNHKTEIQQATLEMQQLTMEDIGREIHDGVGQRLTLASIYSKQLAYKEIPEESKLKIEEVSKLINDSLIQLRTLSKELTHQQEHIVSLKALILIEVEKIDTLKICKINFIADDDCNLKHRIAMFMLRILQEFVQNSLKHSACTEISIALQNSEKMLTMKIADDGKGFNTANNSDGIGIQNMKRRAEMINAAFLLESVEDSGTVLTIKLDHLNL